MGGGVVYLQNCIKLLRFHASSWFCRPVSQESRRSQWIRPLGFTGLIPFWYPFLTSDDPVGRDLQDCLTSGGQKIKSLKTGYVRDQIIGFFGALILFWYPFWMHKKFIFIDFIFWPPEVSKFWRLAKNMKTCPINLK